MSRCTIIDAGHAEVVLQAPRHPAFLAEFKRAIPRRSRRWTSRRWFVHRSCLPRLEAIAKRHFDDVVIRLTP